jgi:hypothetical protein
MHDTVQSSISFHFMGYKVRRRRRRRRRQSLILMYKNSFRVFENGVLREFLALKEMQSTRKEEKINWGGGSY